MVPYGNIFVERTPDNIQMLVTNDCSHMTDGQVKYSPMCNGQGGVIDDTIYRINEEEYLWLSMHDRHRI